MWKNCFFLIAIQSIFGAISVYKTIVYLTIFFLVNDFVSNDCLVAINEDVILNYLYENVRSHTFLIPSIVFSILVTKSKTFCHFGRSIWKKIQIDMFPKVIELLMRKLKTLSRECINIFLTSILTVKHID